MDVFGRYPRPATVHGCPHCVSAEDTAALAERFPPLAALNSNAFRDPRVRVVNEDAMIWIERVRETFDAAIVDFPDPSSFSLGKLYSTRFYRLLRARLTPEAAVSVQSTSPLYARKSYWCIVRTMEAAELATWRSAAIAGAATVKTAKVTTLTNFIKNILLFLSRLYNVNTSRCLIELCEFLTFSP